MLVTVLLVCSSVMLLQAPSNVISRDREMEREKRREKERFTECPDALVLEVIAIER